MTNEIIAFRDFANAPKNFAGYLKSVCTGKTVPDNGHAQTNVTSHTAMVKVR
jgi:hypothetical protein